jgi:hypothetical protein
LQQKYEDNFEPQNLQISDVPHPVQAQDVQAIALHHWGKGNCGTSILSTLEVLPFHTTNLHIIVVTVTVDRIV